MSEIEIFVHKDEPKCAYHMLRNAAGASCTEEAGLVYRSLFTTTTFT